MCGRTSLADSPELLQAYLRTLGVRQLPPWYRPRYNIAPSEDLMVLIEGDRGRKAHAMRWGLVPAWSTDPRRAPINARAETVATNGMFRTAFKKHRGLVVADSFYEWQTHGRAKVPFRIRRQDGKPMLLAAVWDRWRAEDEADSLETVAIVTTGANQLMAPIHQRMPVVLEGDAADIWLDSHASPEALTEVMVPDPSEELTAYPVSTYVNSPTHDDPRCWDPA